MKKKVDPSVAASQPSSHKKPAPLRGTAPIRLLLAIAIVAMVSIPAFALADEGASESDAPLAPAKLDKLSGDESARIDPVQTNADAAAELPHENLGREEATELVTAVFPEQLSAEASFFDELDPQHLISDHVAVVPGTALEPQPALLDSLLPLRAENSSGEKEAVNLALEQSEGILQPINPIVDVELPAQAGDGILLPEVGIRIDLPGLAPDRASSIIDQATAFFPNVGEDSDLLITPTATGVETHTQLRSPDAPLAQTVDLDLPAGAVLNPTPDGGAEVLEGEKRILAVDPPTAIDAEGEAVPVMLEVEGETIVIHANPAPSAAYPILVDPVYETYFWELNQHTSGLENWVANSSYPSRMWAGWLGVNGEPGLNLFSVAGSVTPGSQVNFNYHVPRYFSDLQNPAIAEPPASYIRSITFDRVRWWIENESAPYANDPFFVLGLYDRVNNWWVSYGVHTGSEGKYLNPMGPFPYQNPNENTNVKWGGATLATSESVSRARHLLIGQAAVEVTDNNDPGVAWANGPAKWQNNTATEPITWKATDTGLGVYAVVASMHKSNGELVQAQQNVGCFGNAGTPCPRTYEGAFTNWVPALLPEGENYVEMGARDPIGRASEWSGTQKSALVKVDHSAPQLTLSGSATEQAALGTFKQSYVLKISAIDGTAANPRSGVTKVLVEVDGKVKKEWPEGCPTKNCSLTTEWPIKASDYAAGAHTVIVRAWDGVNLESSKPINLTLHPVAVPTLSLSGSATEQGSLGWSRPRYKLKLSGTAQGEPPAPSDGIPAYLWSLGGFGSEDGQLSRPGGVAIDAKGNVWVADKNNSRVQAFTSGGDFLTKFGSPGPDDGQLKEPRAIAVDPAGNIWVLDTGNRRVQKFNEKGEFLAKFGSPGIAPGQLSAAEGLAVDAQGNVWVADTYNARVQKFNSKGEFVKVVGTKGTGEGQLTEPTGVAIGPGGQVWVADWANNKVVVFNESGNFVRQFGGAGTTDGKFQHPDAITINGKGNVFVSDEGNARVQQFNLAGEYVAKFGAAGSGAGKFSFSYPMGLATDAAGNVWVSDTLNQRVQKWAIPGYNAAYSSAFGAPGALGGQFNHPDDIARDPQGGLWVLDRVNGRVQRFDEGGVYVSKFGALGEANGKFENPVALAFDPKGNLWVLDAGNRRVQQFTAAGVYVSQFGSAGTGNGQFTGAPEGLAIDSKGSIYVSDTASTTRRIQKFNENGEFIKAFGSKGTGAGQMMKPTAIEVGPGNTVWVTDWTNNKVVVFNEAGEFVREFGSTGSGPGQFNHPDALTIDGKGNAWVVDEGNSRVQQFSQTGEYLGKFGSAGTAPGQFSLSYPMGIASDKKGSFWITDGKNNRVQKWTESTSKTKVGTEILIDGKLVDSSESWCLSELCAASRQWTIKSPTTPAGVHTVLAKVIDGFGNTATKETTFKILSDTTKPALQVSGALPTAPEGWVEQQPYSFSATADDANGYGVTSLALKIDGQVAASSTQACPDGGCSLTLSKSVDTEQYSGGAHPAEVVATDGAGNLTKSFWTVNVDPEGHVSAAEAEATLEAVEETTPGNPIGPPEEQPELEGTAPGVGVIEGEEGFVGKGADLPIVVDDEYGGGSEIRVPPPGALAPTCPSEGPQPEEPCVSKGKAEAEAQQAVEHNTRGLKPIEILPVVNPTEPIVEGGLVGENGALYPNIGKHVDSIVRPLFDGVLYFQAIRDAAATESFEWEVNLGPGQELKLLDSRHAMIYYEGGIPAGGIAAEPAHDAIGSAVPTTLSVSQGDVVTLTVHHHSASPAGGGFVYPVLSGAGWEGGFESVMIELPKTEQPKPTEEEEEEETVESLEDGVHMVLRTLGPPKSLVILGPGPIERAFNFDKCTWQTSNAMENIPGDGPKITIASLSQQCHGLLLERPLDWAISVSGHFAYERGEKVWATGGPNCKHWGVKENQPDLKNCEFNQQWSQSRIDAIGDYRFPASAPFFVTPGDTCFDFDGVLPVLPQNNLVPGDPVYHGHFHWHRTAVVEADPCPWGHFPATAIGR